MYAILTQYVETWTLALVSESYRYPNKSHKLVQSVLQLRSLEPLTQLFYQHKRIKTNISWKCLKLKNECYNVSRTLNTIARFFTCRKRKIPYNYVTTKYCKMVLCSRRDKEIMIMAWLNNQPLAKCTHYHIARRSQDHL